MAVAASTGENIVSNRQGDPIERRTAIAVALGVALLIPGTLMGQDASARSVEDELRSMVVEDAPGDVGREAVLTFLDREDVAAVADEHDLDLDDIKAGVRALDVEASADLADRVQDVQGDLVGGDTFVITSSTVIIILLIIILIIVA
jgi:hypothetical protein